MQRGIEGETAGYHMSSMAGASGGGGSERQVILTPYICHRPGVPGALTYRWSVSGIKLNNAPAILDDTGGDLAA